MLITIYCPLLLLCYSVAYTWEVKLPMDDQTQVEEISQYSRDSSPETVIVEKVVKSSMLPYLAQDASKSVVTESISSAPSGSVSKVNTTIRLKFGKESPEQASEGLVFSQASGQPTEYNFKEDLLNSNEHAPRSHTQEMSSHKVIVYNQTKTQQGDSKVISNNLLQQLNSLHWPIDEKIQGITHYTIRKEIHDGSEDEPPVMKQKVKIESNANHDQKDSTRSRNDLNEQRKLIETLQILKDNQKATSVTENPNKQTYDVSDDQVRLLHMLHKLIRNKDINYDFLNRLVFIIYMNGYRDQLLQVLFDIIIEHIAEHGNTEDQQKLTHVLIELWTMLQKLQNRNRENILNENNFSSVELSDEKLRVLQLLQLISKLKESDLNNPKGLRSGYLEELRMLYNSSRNKDQLMNVIYEFWKKNQALHKGVPDPILDTKSHNSEDNSQLADIIALMQYILQKKELSQSEQQVLINYYKNPDFHLLSREEQLKILYDIINKNTAEKEKPKDSLIGQQIYGEVETEDNRVLGTPPHNNEIWEYSKQKKPIVDTHVSENKNDPEIYQILIQLLESSEITDNEELRIKIMEILNRMKSSEVNENESDEENEGGLGISWGIIKKPNLNYESGPDECISGVTWTINCQTCLCVRGLPVCKKLNKCFITNHDEIMQCQPYSTFNLDSCNRCKCNRDGIPICTFKQCKASIPDKENTDVDETWSKYQALQSVICPPERKWPVCAPRTNWRSGCHDCVCDEDGQRHCQKVKNCFLGRKVPANRE